MTEEDLAAQMEADRLLQATLRAQVVKSFCAFSFLVIEYC